jgi:hypothetical protein
LTLSAGVEIYRLNTIKIIRADLFASPENFHLKKYFCNKSVLQKV